MTTKHTPGPFMEWGQQQIDLSTVRFSRDWGFLTADGGFLAWTHSQVRRFAERADLAIVKAEGLK